MDSSDWSNEIRYHIFDTRPDTESLKMLNTFHYGDRCGSCHRLMPEDLRRRLDVDLISLAIAKQQTYHLEMLKLH